MTPSTMDEEAHFHWLIAELPQQLTCLLGDPSTVWRCGAAHQMHAARTQFNEE